MVQLRSMPRCFATSVAAALALLASAPGHAQTSPGDPAQPAPATTPTEPPPDATPPPAPPPPPASPAATAAPAPSNEDNDDTKDHDRFVGHLAVGYFGVTSVPLANPNGTASSISAPVLGVRYWLSKRLGLDIGVGIGVRGGSSETGGTVVDSPTQTGFLLHFGAPLSLYAGEHYSFQLVPEIHGGMAFATLTTPNNPDVRLSGNRVDVGARIGSEIHFGFIDVPELALQGSVGLYFRRQGWSATPDEGQTSGGTQFGIATSVQGDPWAIFTNNISALYYF